MVFAGTTTTTGIKFGGYVFSEPSALSQSAAQSLLDLPGLYAVLVYDPSWRPRPFRPLYFGESHSVRGRATAAHEKRLDWRRAAGSATPLYVSVCSLPGWSLSQRRSAESALIAAYATPCNDRLSVNLADLLRRRVR